MGYFKCTILFNICTISFYLIITMYWLYDFLHNMFMVLLIFARGNFNIGATKPMFLDSGSPREGLCVHGHGLLSLYSSFTKFK